MEQSFTYTWRDVILYNLAVGAKQEELQYVYEDGLKAVPTFGVLPCTATFNTEPYHSMPYMPTELIPDLRTDGTVHMEHSLELYKPIPIGAKLRSEKTISAVYDRGPGKGAQIVVDILVYDELGEKLCLNKMSYLNRWYDSFGGEKQPKTPNPVPEREPDMVLDGSFPENAALLYRLTGDTYPMHASPEIARSVRLPQTAAARALQSRQRLPHADGRPLRRQQRSCARHYRALARSDLSRRQLQADDLEARRRKRGIQDGQRRERPDNPRQGHVQLGLRYNWHKFELTLTNPGPTGLDLFFALSIPQVLMYNLLERRW